MSKKTLVKMPEGHYEIHNEQGAMYCPFQNKIPMQQQNGLVLIPIPCTSGCPHFKYFATQIDTEKYGKIKSNIVELTCGGRETLIDIHDFKEQKLHTTPFAKA